MKICLFLMSLLQVAMVTFGDVNCNTQRGREYVKINRDKYNMSKKPCGWELFIGSVYTFEFCVIENVRRPRLNLTFGDSADGTRILIVEPFICITRDFKIPAINFTITFFVDDECHSKLSLVCTGLAVRDPNDTMGTAENVRYSTTRSFKSSTIKMEFPISDRNRLQLYLLMSIPLAIMILVTNILIAKYVRRHFFIKASTTEPVESSHISAMQDSKDASVIFSAHSDEMRSKGTDSSGMAGTAVDVAVRGNGQDNMTELSLDDSAHYDIFRKTSRV